MNTFSTYWDEHFKDLRISELDKRWVRPEDLQIIFEWLPESVSRSILGMSYEGRPISCLQVGTGTQHIVAWANMHGNETTALRGWMDLFINLEEARIASFFNPLLKAFTIHFIPQLNPDGAASYKRRNAQNIDMNRDARALESPEMQVLLALIERIQPSIAFNLHDQRNIFAVKGKPATISFLAPSVDPARTQTKERVHTMDLIGAANQALTDIIPGSMGRYTDEYYPTAVGERIQQMGIPTILVECGSATEDPLRQQARKCTSIILQAVLQHYLTAEEPSSAIYEAIPLNENNQVDMLIKGIQVEEEFGQFRADIALLAEECIVDGELQSFYKVIDFGDLRNLVALETYIWKETETLGPIKLGAKADLDLITDDGRITIAKGVKK
jgi:hypothetical protein